MSNITVNLHTLTPVHIGSGIELKGNFEYLYFQEQGQLAIIDEGKVFDVIGAENLHHWVSIIEKEEDLLAYLKKRKPGLQPTDVASRLIDVQPPGPRGTEGIKEQLHSGADNVPCIPGSSLKGAVKTAFLTNMVMKRPHFVRDFKNLQRKRGNRWVFSDQQLMGHYFELADPRNIAVGRGMGPNKDLFRFFRLGDLYFETTNTTAFRAEVVNLYREEWKIKSQVTHFLEAIPSGVDASGEFQVAEEQLRQVQKKGMEHSYIPKLQPKETAELINGHTLGLADKELAFWEEEDNPEVLGNYISELRRIVDTINSCQENECVLRLGSGSGWSYMTGAWAKEKVNGDFLMDDRTWDNITREARRGRDYGNVPFPKSRKLLAGGIPLGFVKLSFQTAI
ncbi:MAG: type III-A CRISPR-associated RAMP protein Csm5 [Lewinellaceae bacterium]|nr:type III-A CRISPR-associated RAMP protein Csm5 [Lewinellaceae bacterium]